MLFASDRHGKDAVGIETERLGEALLVDVMGVQTRPSQLLAQFPVGADAVLCGPAQVAERCDAQCAGRVVQAAGRPGQASHIRYVVGATGRLHQVPGTVVIRG